MNKLRYAGAVAALACLAALPPASARAACVTNLGITKTLSPASPGIGEPVTYTIVATNLTGGGGSWNSLSVSDTISGVLVNATTTQPAGWAAPAVTSTASGTRYVWSNPAGFTLANGGSLTFTLVAQVGLVCSTTTMVNSAAGTALAGACTRVWTISNQTSFTTGPHMAACSASKTFSPASPAAGSPLTYQIVMTNTGSATLTSVTVTDTVTPYLVAPGTDQPPGFGAPTLSQVAGSGTRFLWAAAGLSVNPGASLTFTITGLVGLVCSPVVISNTAVVTASSACAAVVQATNAVAFSPALTITAATASKTVRPASPVSGAAVTYQIVVTNAGTNSVSAVTVTDTLPPLITGAITAQPAGVGLPVVTSVAGSGTRFAWSGAGLAVGPGKSLTFTVTGVLGTISATVYVSDTAYVTAGSGCLTATLYTNEAGFALAAPRLDLAKYRAPTRGTTGTVVTFTFSFTNTGNATADSVVLLDTLPPLMQYLAGSAGSMPVAAIDWYSLACSCFTATEPAPANVASVRWTLPVLAAGATGSASFSVRIQ